MMCMSVYAVLVYEEHRLIVKVQWELLLPLQEELIYKVLLAP